MESAAHLQQVLKNGVQYGDVVIVTTLNSVYSIRVLSHDSYLVSGGWFDRHGLSPMNTTIAGCTWGGSIIKRDIIAASGLCLEFGNRVVTSPIRRMYLFTNALTN